MSGAVSNISNYMNLFGVQRSAQSGGVGMIGPASVAALSADSFTLSPGAGMLQQLLNMDLQGPGEAGELDLTGLAQLKQRGEMLAGMLQMKLKNFESGLIAGLKSAGLDAPKEMNLKDGDQGLFLMENFQGKAGIEQFLNRSGDWQKQFQEIARLAQLTETLDQVGTGQSGVEGNPALRYAQQSLSDPAMKSTADFVIKLLQGGSTFSFE